MRKIVEQGGLAGDFKSLDGKSWFDAATARIDLLKTIEDGLAQQLARLMESKKAEADWSLALCVGLTLLSLSASLMAIIVMARSITSPLDKLELEMTRLAKGELDRQVGATDRSR